LKEILHPSLALYQAPKDDLYQLHTPISQLNIFVSVDQLKSFRNFNPHSLIDLQQIHFQKNDIYLGIIQKLN
jgi:hypothetical protein